MVANLSRLFLGLLLLTALASGALYAQDAQANPVIDPEEFALGIWLNGSTDPIKTQAGAYLKIQACLIVHEPALIAIVASPVNDLWTINPALMIILDMQSCGTPEGLMTGFTIPPALPQCSFYIKAFAVTDRGGNLLCSPCTQLKISAQP